MSPEDIAKIRACSDLLEPPAPEVVRQLCDAYEALLAEYERVRAEKVTMALDFCAITEKAKAAIAEAEALEKDAARYHTLAVDRRCSASGYLRAALQAAFPALVARVAELEEELATAITDHNDSIQDLLAEVERLKGAK